MALHSYLAANPNATKHDIEHSMDGNLCRCTGYRPILDAAKQFGKESEDCAGGARRSCGGRTPDFPEFLKDFESQPIEINGKSSSWYRPTSLKHLLELKDKYPQGKIVVGSTEVSIEMKFKNYDYPVLMNPLAIPQMTAIKTEKDGISVGAAASLTSVVDYFKNEMKRRPDWQTRTLHALVDQIRWFAGPQIKNVACIGGNIATASPISDINPVLIAMGAKLTVNSIKYGERQLRLTQELFPSYRKLALQPEEVIVSVFVPFSSELEYVRAYKQSRRREDDIAIVSAAFRVSLEKREHNYIIKDACLSYGGMDAVTKEARKTSQYLLGKPWNNETLLKVNQYLADDLPLAPDAVGGMVAYRKTLSTSFWHKFSLFVSQSLGQPVPDRVDKMDVIPERSLSRGIQTHYPEHSPTPVGSSMPHVSALKQVTGEAIYIDDMPANDTHYGHFVMSTKANAKIVKVNPEKALKMEGVVAFISAKDIPGHNEIGFVYKGEELFASSQVHGVGFPIGLIVATSHRLAEKAALAVEVEYAVEPHILTIREAIQKSSFFQTFSPPLIERGQNPEAVFPKCEHVLEGEMEIGGQEHFYLEPHTSHVVPGEDNEYTVYASTQNPNETQILVAEVLGVPQNRVVCKVKRLGGGFGGKETRSLFVSCAAAVAAKKIKKPVRITLDREDDMMMSGGRNPFMGKYKVGFTSDGKIEALDIKLYANAGWSVDMSAAIMDRALFHVDNAYFIPNISAKGFICKTNIATNTAFRGFGGPQSMLICETWIDRMAKELNLSPNQVRRKNMYTVGQSTHYNQTLKDHDATIIRCWDKVIELSDFDNRLKEIEEWNKKHLYRKRGIACIPTKYGLSFTIKMLNQASALVHIYSDGTVLVSHGGTEMGQGLHTKMIQVAATALNIPTDRIYIAETATDKVANASPTAASVQSDLNGGAVLNACNILNERLAPFKKDNPNATFKEIVNKAYREQTNLSANGHYAREDVGYDFKTRSGKPFAYFVNGAACAEVEIDALTGDHQILRTDIVMDLGRSLSPAIDIGQIEGAFTQGFGWCTIEEVVYLNNGLLHSRGPGTYKIPGFQDIPLDMRVHLLKDASNPTTIYSSKGVGEPPLFLGTSVFFCFKRSHPSLQERTRQRRMVPSKFSSNLRKDPNGLRRHPYKTIFSKC
eukprot:TRINITY_DN14117_c0_g1_i1.p1 TRINITY_DN14117_c0_g1~~TRINITY_DN14117_c0_g1_i1.p1  ORF type:complete len:1314 (+),score=314.98 TRINITY_DN14117_c0_g1_i1:452-3943(+)